MPPRVVLIGLPGTGKSSVGTQLAHRLGLPFADSDELITHQTGRSVADIFAGQGETAFRELEADMIAEALAGFGGVLALGGGAVTTGSVRDDLLASGVPVVLLTAPLNALADRLAAAEPRPLLAGDVPARLAELAAVREPLYRAVATATVDTGGRSVDEVAADLSGQLAAAKP